MGNHNIYLPEKYEQLIVTKKKGDESIGQTAKRLLLASLDAELTTLTQEIPQTYLTRLAAVEERLNSYEQPSLEASMVTNVSEMIDSINTEIEGLKGKFDTTGDVVEARITSKVSELEESLVNKLSSKASTGMDFDSIVNPLKEDISQLAEQLQALPDYDQKLAALEQRLSQSINNQIPKIPHKVIEEKIDKTVSTHFDCFSDVMAKTLTDINQKIQSIDGIIESKLKKTLKENQENFQSTNAAKTAKENSESSTNKTQETPPVEADLTKDETTIKEENSQDLGEKIERTEVERQVKKLFPEKSTKQIKTWITDDLSKNEGKRLKTKLNINCKRNDGKRWTFFQIN